MTHDTYQATRSGRRTVRAHSGGWLGIAGHSFAWLIGLSVLCVPPYSLGASPDLVDRSAYDAAIQNIPFDRMTDDAQARLWRIISQPTIFRRLPVTRVESDPDLYLFLARYPEIIVNMWELMGVTKVKLRRTGDYTFDVSDGAGTTSKVELIYGDRNTHVLIAEGSYEGPLLKRLVQGRCILVLHSSYAPSPVPKTQITNQLDVFVQLDNIGAELVAKTLYPLVGKSADHNFIETTRFLGQVSLAAETRQAGMQQLATRLTRVDPAVRDRFATVSTRVYERANGQAAQAEGMRMVPASDQLR